MDHPKRRGRPTASPKDTLFRFRLDRQTADRLVWCSKKLDIDRSAFLRDCIDREYEQMQNS